MEYARTKGVHTVLRGMRAVSDFEYEYEMTFMNRKLDRDIDTIFMMTGLRWLFVHSKTIKAAVKAGADVSGMVPEHRCPQTIRKTALIHEAHRHSRDLLVKNHTGEQAMKIAKRMEHIKPSPTLAVSAKAAAMKAEGIDVIGFGAGEPDFDTPDHIKQAAIAALEAGFTKYTPAGGTPELKKTVAAKLQRDNSLEYKNSEILISCGAKHSLYNAFQALLNEGDEIIIPAPYWVSYPDMAYLAGAVPVIIETTDASGFKVDARAGARGNNPPNPGLCTELPLQPDRGCLQRG